MKRILEKVRKLRLYFTKSNSSYVSYRGEDISMFFVNFTVQYFPLDYQSTLTGPLFERFDENGLPLKFLNGDFVYFHTKIFTYALAHWNKYLDTSDEQSARIVLQVCQYIIENAVEENCEKALLFREYVVNSGFSGKYSGAMEQGLGAFILTAGYQISQDHDLVQAARKCIEPLMNDQGRGIRINWKNLTWFEEFPHTTNHVLNGYLDAVMGVWAYTQVSKDQECVDFLGGILSNLQHQVKCFDRGWWSNYWFSEKSFDYIASMKYHTIHVYQIRFMAKISGNESLLQLGNDFENYSNRFLNRMMALGLISFQKLKITKNNP